MDPEKPKNPGLAKTLPSTATSTAPF